MPHSPTSKGSGARVRINDPVADALREQMDEVLRSMKGAEEINYFKAVEKQERERAALLCDGRASSYYVSPADGLLAVPRQFSEQVCVAGLTKRGLCWEASTGKEHWPYSVPHAQASGHTCALRTV